MGAYHVSALELLQCRRTPMASMPANVYMKKQLLALVIIAISATICIADEMRGNKETMEDIARHRATAVAHEAAANCLESGKFCGIKHAH